ncbi:putative metallophosphoesterase [Caulifigura coniformis]|uniref:Putative metallophosphoesterase n=1 Tax=Caulifigura coniformis TaxID=2527983 RepID=A0A517S829_9PLAN|nr:metallophosphoesterase [Caulifigura coniformis]QDT52285.1 putative metallophosphoesterase [Caulifigura coniformis]
MNDGPETRDETDVIRGRARRPWSRRQWLAAAAGSVAAGAAGFGGYVFRFEPHWVEIVRREMPIAGLPAGLEGKTLLQLSDLHIGSIVDDGYLIGALQKAAALEPDIVVQTGDLIQDAPSGLPKAARILEHFPRGKRATLSILGNHDYGPGWSHMGVGESTAAVQREAGLTVLRNSSVDVDGLRIAGLEELLGPFWRDGLAAGVVRDDRPHVILCHNPDACDRSIWRGRRPEEDYGGWILSGHTHGGQVSLPFYGPPILPVINKRYTSGEFYVGGERRLYINRALGYLRRVRFNVRPEITLFTLRSASPA